MSQNQNQIKIDKKTPLHDITWYVKWAATVIILLAMAGRSIPQLMEFDIALSMIGALMWGYVGFKWHDRALMTVNIAAASLLLAGLLRLLFT